MLHCKWCGKPLKDGKIVRSSKENVIEWIASDNVYCSSRCREAHEKTLQKNENAAPKKKTSILLWILLFPFKVIWWVLRFLWKIVGKQNYMDADI
nr:hypothetical protein [uncultured Capnocytophaga sp.]